MFTAGTGGSGRKPRASGDDPDVGEEVDTFVK